MRALSTCGGASDIHQPAHRTCGAPMRALGTCGGASDIDQTAHRSRKAWAVLAFQCSNLPIGCSTLSRAWHNNTWPLLYGGMVALALVASLAAKQWLAF